MKTTRFNKSQKFADGFFLDEVRLIRLSSTIESHMSKLDGTTISREIKITQKDGLELSTDDIHEVLGAENGGSKEIVFLHIHHTASQNAIEPPAEIEVYFDRKASKGTSFGYSIAGWGQEWVTLALGDVTDRLDAIRKNNFLVSALKWIKNNNSTIISVIFIPWLLMFLVGYVTSFAGGSSREDQTVADKLQEAYHRGEIENAVEALIYSEKLKEDARRSSDFLFQNRTNRYIFIFWILSLVFFILSSAIPIRSIGIFYWGDFVESYGNRQKWINRIWWGFLFAGVLAGVVSALIYQGIQQLR